jgi:hypothetical protein
VTDAFFTYIIEMERIEKIRKQMQGEYQSTYVLTDCCLYFLNDPENDKDILSEIAFNNAKEWEENNPGAATKFAIPCILPGHFTLLWFDMEHNKYYYGDSLKKRQGEIMKEAKHFITMF